MSLSPKWLKVFAINFAPKQLLTYPSKLASFFSRPHSLRACLRSPEEHEKITSVLQAASDNEYSRVRGRGHFDTLKACVKTFKSKL